MRGKATDCRAIRADLTAYLAGETAPRQTARIRAHVSRCPACHAEARTLAATLDAVRGALADPAQIPARLDPERRARIRAAPRPRKVARFINPRALAIAALLLVALGITALLLPAGPALMRGRMATDTSFKVAAESSPLVMRGQFAARSGEGRADMLRRNAGRDSGEVARAPAAAPDDAFADAAPPIRTKIDRRASEVAGFVGGVREEAAPVPPVPAEPRPTDKRVSTREIPAFNPFVDTALHPFSTFSMDVDTAAYALTRAHVRAGRRPPPELVRTEELINAFDYDYPPPAAGAFAIHARLVPTPFRPGLHVLRIGVKARRVGRDQNRPALLTLVVDTSGSMDTPDRLGRIRAALPRLVEALAPEDRIALVQFDRRARLVLPPTPAADREHILAAIDGLAVGGGTHLEAGLVLGYRVAAQHFQPGASNRVMLLTDGVANLGAATAEELLAAVAGYREQGIYLTVLGFGIGAYDDDLLKSLAQRGDGAYVFIDSEAEAQRVLVDDLAATLHTVANDAKIQVEFNPARIVRYRQIGYERRQLTTEDFRDDTVDAGEVGSGQSVTALYEVELADMPAGRGPIRAPVATVSIRYEDVETGRVEEQVRAVRETDRSARFEDAPPRTRLALVVAEFAEVLRGNPLAAGTTLADVIEQLRPVAEALPLDSRIRELVDMVEAARRQPGW